MKTSGGIQMPDDSIATSYRQTRPFHYEQTFRSSKYAFEGTEQEFIAAGLAYRYVQSGFTRVIKTENVYPPIPIRTFDWLAHVDGQEERLSGHGETEQDAIADLIQELSERDISQTDV